MNRLGMLVTMAGMILAAGGIGFAADLGTPPAIDGSLTEWQAAGTQYIYAEGTLGGEQIGTGKLYMAFDDDNFYLAYDLEDAGTGDDYLYAFDGGFWFPDASGYNSSYPLPTEHVLTSNTLELRQSWTGVRGPGAVYGEWYIDIVSNNAKRIIRFGSIMDGDSGHGTGNVNNLTSYVGTYDGEDPFPGAYTTTDVDKDGWIMTGFSPSDPHFGQFAVPEPGTMTLIGLGGVGLLVRRRRK